MSKCQSSMKIFLSALENTSSSQDEGRIPISEMLVRQGVQLKWNLMSYYYVKGSKEKTAKYIRDHSDLILIDSGAHSFQFGKKVNWLEYTEQYAKFIKEFDRPNVVGYFEMDIENVIGYDAVLELRKIINRATDKVIPVWHPLRGIDNYERMCEEYAGQVVAIGGFKGTDIKDSQYLQFLKVAKRYGCKVHCLGMTRREVLDNVPFDYTDSSSWVMQALTGKIGVGGFSGGKVPREVSRERRGFVFCESYKKAMQMQQHYYRRWRKECKD